jgi:electron-transferring-flavoprotein dehydrogenase
MDVDIVCAGFGPAAGGFLTTLSSGLPLPDGSFPQVLCYERADDIGFGVSGVVTKARGIRQSFPDFDPAAVPMATPVTEEKVLYLLDPVGASRRPGILRLADQMLRTFGWSSKDALELPFSPSFLHKKGGFVLSLGQFNQWVGEQLMMKGAVQICPAMPVAEPIFDNAGVSGVRLLDQGVDSTGFPTDAYMPGMDIHAALTVVADGPVGAVGRAIDARFGMPPEHVRREWAAGMKIVIELPEAVDLEPGTVFHTIGYPEPEIFGFFYVHPERIASAGIFVPSWFDSPVRTSYRYLQHFLMHPFLWQYVGGGRMRSWGAKTIQESGRRGEPYLAGDGWARIGEGSGSTNVLTGSGVDEAWTTGAILGESVLELLREGKPFTRENLDRTYVARRRESILEKEARIAERARDGFHRSVLAGFAGMAVAGWTQGRAYVPGQTREKPASLEQFFENRIPPREIERIRQQCRSAGKPLHDALMDRAGWPAIPYDGLLLTTHQDALLMGGKVQAAPGYADHVSFVDIAECERCGAQTCVEICSGQALEAAAGGGAPVFDREKCVHCGVCMWNCEKGNLVFRAGAGGLHSAEN